jgi:hypothetical protein
MNFIILHWDFAADLCSRTFIVPHWDREIMICSELVMLQSLLFEYGSFRQRCAHNVHPNALLSGLMSNRYV